MKDLLERVAQAGLRFEVDCDELRIIAPPGALTEDLRNSIRVHKQEILVLLRTEKSAIAKPLPVLQLNTAVLSCISNNLHAGQRQQGSELGSYPSKLISIVQYRIDSQECIVCAACASLAPNIFEVDFGAETARILHQPSSPDEVTAAAAAAAACPVAAIVRL